MVCFILNLEEKKLINGKTKIVGIFGWPVEHTFSPIMHNAAFAHLNLNYVYIPFPVDPVRLGEAVDGIRSLGLTGVNVTIPHKTAVMPYLDRIDEAARLIGAVNTIVNDNGILTGYNTDAPGFVKSLEVDGGINPRGKRIVILGAGGAARAVAVQLALAGAREIVFSARDLRKSAQLQEIITGSTNAQTTDAVWGDVSGAGVEQTDILINSTPLGMHPNIEIMPPVNLQALPDTALVCDMIYNPRETLFLKKARARGLKTLNGLGMLLYQGAIAFELWTNTEAPVEVMKDRLEKVI
jgi:shikimate dehydrogenase